MYHFNLFEKNVLKKVYEGNKIFDFFNDNSAKILQIA